MNATAHEFPVSERAGYAVITLPARVDVTNTHGLLTAFGEIATGPIALDLDATQTVDSTALGAIVTIYKRLRARGDDLVLVAIGEGVRRALALTRLDRVFSVLPSVHSLGDSESRPSQVSGTLPSEEGVERVS